MQTRLQLSAIPPFNFDYTVYSHGWAVLDPNLWDRDRSIFKTVLRLSSGQVVGLRLKGRGGRARPGVEVRITHVRALTPADRSDIRESVTHMLRLDEDLSPFYLQCRRRGGDWVEMTAGLGRLLRSPSLFEDIVKVICTTNIHWSGTRAMVQRLVQTHGQPYPDGGDLKAFPPPAAIAGMGEGAFADSVRMGYRAPYVHELARRILAGDLRLDTLTDSGTPTPQLKKRLLAIKGVGPYAAATLLMLIGRYDELPVDSVCRDFCFKKYFGGEKVSDAEIRKIYQDWGRWKYLAYWFDVWKGFEAKV